MIYRTVHHDIKSLCFTTEMEPACLCFEFFPMFTTNLSFPPNSYIELKNKIFAVTLEASYQHRNHT